MLNLTPIMYGKNLHSFPFKIRKQYNPVQSDIFCICICNKKSIKEVKIKINITSRVIFCYCTAYLTAYMLHHKLIQINKNITNKINKGGLYKRTLNHMSLWLGPVGNQNGMEKIYTINKNNKYSDCIFFCKFQNRHKPNL